MLALVVAPAGALLAPEPARTAELIVWAFLSAWLLRVHRPLAPAGWPRAIVVPAALYAACAAASWTGIAIANAGGVPPLSLPGFLLTAIPQHYLVSSPAETETSTVLQLLAGDTAAAEASSNAAFELGTAMNYLPAFSTFGAQLMEIRRQQGRLEEVIALAERGVEEYETLPGWNAAVAVLYAELGHLDKVREIFDAAATTEFGGVPRDVTWLPWGAPSRPKRLIFRSLLPEDTFMVVPAYVPHGVFCSETQFQDQGWQGCGL